MVLHESGSSTNTLVSLPTGKLTDILGPLDEREQDIFRPTCLFLPELDSAFDNDRSWTSCKDETDNSKQILCLPKVGSVDEHLPSVFLDTRDELLLHGLVEYSAQTTERLLYVGQGEFAHAISAQCDVLVTDKATTCHILALRSESLLSRRPPLTSLTHIDGTQYSDCLRNMIHRHAQYHGEQDIRIDVHIVGGFNDEKETSLQLSNWLVHLLADIAQEHSRCMSMTLQTCSISSLNDDGHGSPLCRGLAISTKTGKVCLVNCHASVVGPCRSLRCARLLSSQTKLAFIHSELSNDITIASFAYHVPLVDLEILLSLPDELLLQVTSTSPHCEDDDFCTSMRATLQWVRDHHHLVVFNKDDLVFRRIGCNDWRSVCGRYRR